MMDIDAQLIQWYSEGLSVKEQVVRSGLTRPQLNHRRRRLAKQGAISIPAKPPTWTEEDLFRLEIYRDKGNSPKQIARMLGRTLTGLHVKSKRARIPVQRSDVQYTARDVQRLLGMRCCKIVTRWIELGWLHSRTYIAGRRNAYRISHDSLMAMLSNENTWMAWRAEDITDDGLREWAIELRADKPRWLTPGEVAAYYCVVVSAVNDWIHKGLLRSVRYGNHWIRESELEAFVIPSKTNYQQRGWDERKRKAA